MIDIVRYTHLIKPSTGRKTLIKSQYNTNDIVSVILKENERAYLDVEDFAKEISKHANSTYELGLMLWSFLKKHIKYREDGMLFQAIKSPAKLWADKSGDCKSYTIFVTAVFRALNLPYTIRFVSYGAFAEIYTHVYPVLNNGSIKYIADAVWTGKYNTEKKFNFKKDYMNKGLYSMGSVTHESRAMKTARRKGVLQLPKDINNEGGIELSIIRQRLEIERDIMNDHNKIGKVDEYDRSLDVVDELMASIDNEDFETMDAMIEGIGWSFKGAWNKTRNFVKKVGEKIRSGVKTLKKAVTAPAKYAARKILQYGLPSVAPLFLYLFISPKLLSRVPSAVRSKRNKQKIIADIFVNSLGFKRNLLMGILRNGIMKRYRKSPEALLASQFKGIAGIGFAISMSVLIPIIIKLIRKLVQYFGGSSSSIESDAKGMAPDSADIQQQSYSSSSYHTPHGRRPFGSPKFQLYNANNHVANAMLRKDKSTAPGTTVQAFGIPQDGGKTGPKGWCS